MNVNRCILYSKEAYRSDEVKSFVRGQSTFNEDWWNTVIFDLFQDIKVELGTPLDVDVASDARLGLFPDTDDDVLPEVDKEVVEYDVIDGDVDGR